MKIVADLHLHSRFSRATSKEMNLADLALAAEKKGVNILGTGDFTHPEWFRILKEQLVEAEPGLFKLKSEFLKKEGRFSGTETRFLLSCEISCVYSKGGKVRKVHHLILAPSLKVVEKINVQLGWVGNLAADGRPILGLDSEELLKIVMSTDEHCFLIPAHIWTPWFSIFGSKSGFDSISECFGDYSQYIFALETGLSSDPAMNWRLSALDRYTLVSFSDAHSAPKIAREATVFDIHYDYFELINALKNKDAKKILYTIEFFPEEGKYHYDGHRLCGVRLEPKETNKLKGICPKCLKPLTIGVLNRVEKLADRPEGFVPAGAIPFKNLVPLQEIIASVLSQKGNSKQVAKFYDNLINNLGPELNILLDAPLKEIEKSSSAEIAKGIELVRAGKVIKEPGYDGVFGVIKVLPSQVKKEFIFQEKENSQKTLFG
jgi:DNA helicase-2/ATP-dependent DNA helicase PcrA